MIPTLIIFGILSIFYYMIFAIHILVEGANGMKKIIKTKKRFWLMLLPFGVLFLLITETYNSLESDSKDGHRKH